MDALVVFWAKGALVLAVGAAVVVIARRTSAATRHLVWTASLAGALLLPAASAIVPSLRVSLPAEQADVVGFAVAPPPRAAPVAPAVQSAQPLLALVEPAAPPRFELDWRRVAPIVWLAVALALLLRIAAGSLQLRGIARRARAVKDEGWLRLLARAMAHLELGREVRLVESDDTDVPLTWGSVRPVVVLPAAAARWPDDQRWAVLIHELAHAQRLDSATQLVARVACAVCWVDPLAWLAAAAMRSERERACDDRVLEAGARPTDYATNLLDVARAALRDDAPAAALAMARKSQLEGRLLAVLDPRRDRRPLSASRAAAIACGAACLVLPLAAVRAERGESRAPRPGVAVSVSSDEADAQSALVARVAAPARPAPAAPAGQPAPPAPPAPPAAAPGRPAPPASAAPSSRGSFSHIVSTDEKVWTVSWSDDRRAVEIAARGDVRWNDDATDVASIGSGGSLQVSVHEGGRLTHAEIQPAAGGLRRTLLVEGEQRPWDAAWFSELLRELDQHTGFASEARFPRLYREKGARGVLEQAARLQSDYALRRYLTMLIEADPMQESTAITVIRLASKMHGDYDRAELLKAVAAKARLDTEPARAEFLRACEGIAGDYERSRVLHVLVDQPKLSTALIRGVLESASTLHGDYEKSTLLAALAGRHPVDPLDYLDAAATLSGDYERARSLKALIAAQRLPDAAQIEVIRQSARMGDYESAEVLLALAAKQRPAGDVRREYEEAARRLGDYSRQRVLAAVR